MTSKIPEMTDMMFDLDGGTLPVAYPFALWEALIRRVPQLAEEKSVGVLPLRATENNEGVLLPKRAKLVLRLPLALTAHAAALSGQQLNVSGNTLRLGAVKMRAIQPYSTIHTQLVTGASDEALFMENIKSQIKKMGIAAGLICGKRRTLTGAQQSIHGYSLVIYDLKPGASLQLQYAGLGENRQFGCGVFVPYKAISGLG